jgi:hypothetical protein
MYYYYYYGEKAIHHDSRFLWESSLINTSGLLDLLESRNRCGFPPPCPSSTGAGTYNVSLCMSARFPFSYTFRTLHQIQILIQSPFLGSTLLIRQSLSHAFHPQRFCKGHSGINLLTSTSVPLPPRFCPFLHVVLFLTSARSSWSFASRLRHLRTFAIFTLPDLLCQWHSIFVTDMHSCPLHPGLFSDHDRLSHPCSSSCLLRVPVLYWLLDPRF